MQTLQTFSPRGFRYLELHIANPLVSVDAIIVEAEQRTYFDQPVGSFQCSDPLLNEIWMMGVRTLQSCSEDALTDTPTRERGQWLGVVGNHRPMRIRFQRDRDSLRQLRQQVVPDYWRTRLEDSVQRVVGGATSIEIGLDSGDARGRT